MNTLYRRCFFISKICVDIIVGAFIENSRIQWMIIRFVCRLNGKSSAFCRTLAINNVFNSLISESLHKSNLPSSVFVSPDVKFAFQISETL